jgi:hypothetical protein
MPVPAAASPPTPAPSFHGSQHALRGDDEGRGRPRPSSFPRTALPEDDGGSGLPVAALLGLAPWETELNTGTMCPPRFAWSAYLTADFAGARRRRHRARYARLGRRGARTCSSSCSMVSRQWRVAIRRHRAVLLTQGDDRAGLRAVCRQTATAGEAALAGVRRERRPRRRPRTAVAARGRSRLAMLVDGRYLRRLAGPTRSGSGRGPEGTRSPFCRGAQGPPRPCR